MIDSFIHSFLMIDDWFDDSPFLLWRRESCVMMRGSESAQDFKQKPLCNVVDYSITVEQSDNK